VKRGEIWTAAGAADYAGKPRPWLVFQSDTMGIEASVILLGFTTDITESATIRPLVTPTPENGLHAMSRLMVDKISAIPRNKLGKPIGRLTDEQMEEAEMALLMTLGFAG
jgi:mRNA interferase MazF